MKLTIPSKTVEVCDLCTIERGTILALCIICGHVYCEECAGATPPSYVDPSVCRECGDREDVHRIVRRHESDLEAVIVERDAALRRLRKRKGDDQA